MITRWLTFHDRKWFTSKRPLTTLRDFADYCCKYHTSICIQAVKGTHELSNRIVELKWEIESYGPLEMTDIEEKAKELQNKTWQLQRVLDRLNGNDRSPMDKQYNDIEENLHCLTDWFGNEKHNLKQLFEKYLKIS